MISSRGKPLTPETKKLTVSVKKYFDQAKITPAEPSVKRTAEAIGIGVATVKRIMADYNRDPSLLDKQQRCRGALFMQPSIIDKLTKSRHEAPRWLDPKFVIHPAGDKRRLRVPLWYEA